MDFVIHEDDDAAEIAARVLEGAGYRVWVTNGSLEGIPRDSVALYTSTTHPRRGSRRHHRGQLTKLRHEFLVIGPEGMMPFPEHAIVSHFADKVAICPRDDLAHGDVLPRFAHALLRMAESLERVFPGEHRFCRQRG